MYQYENVRLCPWESTSSPSATITFVCTFIYRNNNCLLMVVSYHSVPDLSILFSRIFPNYFLLYCIFILFFVKSIYFIYNSDNLYIIRQLQIRDWVLKSTFSHDKMSAKGIPERGLYRQCTATILP